jgi:putative restriction endonuclease
MGQPLAVQATVSLSHALLSARGVTLLYVDSEVELHLRELIFQQLAEIVAEHGVVTRTELESLRVGDETRRVIDRNRGIWNPRDMLATLSVISNPSGPYADTHVGESLFAYDYRAGSIGGDNKKMRRAYELGLPIILLRTIRPGVFVPVFPVYVVADDTVNRQFVLALDEGLRSVADPLHLKPIEREYAVRAIKQRLHQPEFRGRIMLAYDQRCTVCALKHGKLLDAAHIIGDDKEHGVPVVENGLSMCKIHHAAYDANLLGISPDCVVRINTGLMAEVDGPMLRHGLQEMDGRPIIRPKRHADQPSKDRLAERFEEFLKAS